MSNLTNTRRTAPLVGSPGAASLANVNELVRRGQTQQSDPRRRAQARRERILRSRHSGDLECLVRRIYSKEFAEEICAQITVTANPFADVISGVLQLYRGGASRQIHGATEDEQEAFHAFVVESGIEALAHGWSEMGYASGPQFVVPSIRRQRLRLLAPQPSTSDVILDAEDPTGAPVAVSYQVGAAEGGGVAIAVVDGESTRFLDPRGGHPLERPGTRIEHGLGDCPAAPLRFWAAESDDWWGEDRNQRLVDGALTVGHLAAMLRHIRKAQNAHLLTIKGNLDGIARGQQLGNPSGPIYAREDGESPDETRRTEFEVHNFDTSPQNTLQHIRAEVEWMAESTGVPVQVSTDGGSQWDYSWDHEALAELRKALHWWAIVWERQLWFAAVSIAKFQRHPLASRLPDPKLIEEGFTLTLPPLHRKFSDPIAEQAWWAGQLKNGQASVLDMARRYHGQLSDRAHTDAIMRRLAINISFWDLVASRNQPLGLDGNVPPTAAVTGGPNGFTTAAQAQGALGPAVRDGQIPPPGDG